MKSCLLLIIAKKNSLHITARILKLYQKEDNKNLLSGCAAAQGRWPPAVWGSAKLAAANRCYTIQNITSLPHLVDMIKSCQKGEML